MPEPAPCPPDVPASPEADGQAAPSPPARHGSLTQVQRHYFLVIFLLTTLLLGLILWPFWQLLILAFLLAGSFRPCYAWLQRWMSSWLASLCSCILIFLIVFIPLVFCIGAISSEAHTLYQLGKDSDVLLKLQRLLQDNTLIGEVQQVLAGYNINFTPADLTALVSDLARTAGLFIYNQASSWAANIMSFVIQFCMLLLVVFFLFMEIDRLICFLKKLSPLPDEHNELLMHKFLESSGGILIGNGISGIFQGILGGAYFSILGLNSPVLWGGVMAILAFLPIFGIGLVMVPTAALLLANGYAGQALITVCYYMVLSFSVEYLVKPKLMGEQIKMHALLVLLAIIGGMSVFGVLGIIYGPLIATAFLTLADLYVQHYCCSSESS